MRFYCYLLLFFILVSCNQRRSVPAYMTVDQKSGSASVVELKYLTDSFQPFDTAQINPEGLWEFRKDSVPAGFYQLYVDQKAILRLVISDTAPTQVILNNNSVEVIGSPESKALHEVELLVTDCEKQLQILANRMHDSIPESNLLVIRDSLFNEIETEKQRCRQGLDKVYHRFPGSLVQLAILFQKVGNHSLYLPLEDYSMFYATDSLLAVTRFNYQPVQSFQQKVDSLRQLKQLIDKTSVGKRMPAFELPNAWGEKHGFVRYKGKNALVVVWSSGSEASRQVTKNLLRNTRTLRRQGVEIVMISMDTDAALWKRAIRDDRLSFNHLSDLKGWDSPIVKQLGITSQPIFWVVDIEGMIQCRTENVDSALSTLSQIIKN